ncbi:hypothetical protein [Paenibacillus sophorae]|uniref:Uncharacterized protein n=1 Tax=Paenibacillus sophorae TaxID=1333845 RepID=A0ABX8HBS4_9BACL|nr:hypothetical protein [Paenibacillus sophorae]QWU15559.1 hypothetical protein KP014_27530 [Paenibacillus sophorae]
MENKGDYYCKLIEKVIELGLCMDINYEREKIFKTNTLEKLGITVKDADSACKTCPYCPLC